MYITCLWCNKIPIGNSKVEVYINIIEFLLSRTAKKHPEVHPTSEASHGDILELFEKLTCQERNCRIPNCEKHKHKFCQKFYSLLTSLAKLAYYTLFSENRENTLVFDQCVAEKYLEADHIKFSLLSGILTGSTTRTLMELSHKVSFSHKTIQEFFAALFIGTQRDRPKLFLKKCTNVQNILDMSMICEFLSKMNSKIMSEILPCLMSVINEDEETCRYRTEKYMYMFDIRNEPLYNIQKMLLSCLKQMPESENIKLCLQDFYINGDTIHDKNLQCLSKQNQTNIKSLYINIGGTSSSLCDIIALYSLTDLNNLPKLYFRGGRNKEVDLRLLLSENLKHVRLSLGELTNYDGNLYERIITLRHVQYLDIGDFTLSHEIRGILYDFISNNRTLKQLSLGALSCKEHSYEDCTGNFDLFIKHSQLEKLVLLELSALNLTLTSKSLANVKLEEINLGENSVLLSRDMSKIEHVVMEYIEISAESIRDFIDVIEKLPQSVKVWMLDCDITPNTEYKRVRNYIRRSQKFVVISDGKWFKFQTTTRSSTTTTTTAESARAIPETTSATAGSASN